MQVISGVGEEGGNLVFWKKKKPSIEKTAQRQGDLLNVYLTVKNPTKRGFGQMTVCDFLPENSGVVQIFTKNISEKTDGNSISWELTDVAAAEKRIIHYQINFQNVKLPNAILKWEEN
ncbi:MAG: hypothetical protein ABH950_08580 [Candidatus Altiarchaeota archaeon]